MISEEDKKEVQFDYTNRKTIFRKFLQYDLNSGHFN